ncbi:MAG: aminotransferase class V-fold PLP-dependent enzyme [Bacteroidetes bacterium]|nr:aminotransferase class V-fold PLP-dependent enzyme [Bacteroidota bacterium]
MTLTDIRSEFPFLSTGMIYLNHAATGPWSRYVERRVQAHVRGRTDGPIDIFQDTIRLIGEARAMAAEMLGTDPARVAFVLNTSEGLNILAQGLDWKTGDRVLLIDQEFPSNIYPFINLRGKGVEIDFVPQRNGRIELDDIERALTPRTRILAVSWVQFLSGFTLDLAALKDLCAPHGTLLSVDAIQGVGGIRLDLRNTPVDFLAAGVQKWQLGPQGVGIVYVSERAQEMIRQAHLGWISVANAWNFFNYGQELQPDARRYENGTFNSIGISGYHGALEFFRTVGFDRVDEMVRANAAHLYAKAQEMDFTVVTPENPCERAGIVTLRHERAEEVQRTLQENGMVVSARVGHIRISPHFYNTPDEIDTVLDAIRALG